MNWSARGNVLNQYLRNTSIGTTVNQISSKLFSRKVQQGSSLIDPVLLQEET
jgi:hypothetical protein